MSFYTEGHEPIGPLPGSDQSPVLVHAGRAADATVLLAALSEGGVNVEAMNEPGDLAGHIADAACAVFAQEGLTPAVLEVIGAALGDQPSWSELPILVLVDGHVDAATLRSAIEAHWRDAQVTVLVRPVAPVELMTALHTALASRMRQFLLRDQLHQEAQLRRELNHRVRNLLVTVQAMAKMSGRLRDDPNRFEAFQHRLVALTAFHARLFDMPEGSAMSFGVAVRTVLGPLGVLDGERLAFTEPERPLKVEAAKTLALCIQELASNALEHGALTLADGRVRLDLSLDEGQATLRWTEANGPPVGPPSRRGYGTRFVTGALAGLFGSAPELVFDPMGFHLTVEGSDHQIVA